MLGRSGPNADVEYIPPHLLRLLRKIQIRISDAQFKRYRHRTPNLTGSSDYRESFADGRRTIRLADVLGF
jgi:hypothetical protein